MDIFEKEQLILHSYLPIEKKTEMLKQLSRTGGGEEKRMVAKMCHVYKRYISLLRHPETRTVFLLKYSLISSDRITLYASNMKSFSSIIPSSLFPFRRLKKPCIIWHGKAVIHIYIGAFILVPYRFIIV